MHSEPLALPVHLADGVACPYISATVSSSFMPPRAKGGADLLGGPEDVGNCLLRLWD